MSAGGDKGKLLVLGLDGVSCSYLQRAFAEGDLPVLKSLFDGGQLGPLASTEIVLTPVAWSTSYTGVNPARHRICGFSRRKPNSYKWSYVSPDDRAHKEFWRILDEQGYQSILVGPIFCRVQRDFSGVYVGGEYCGDIANNIHPPELAETVMDEFGYKPVSPCSSLEEVERFVRTKFDLTRRLMAEHPWNLCFLGFMEPDLLHHTNDPDFARAGYRIFDRLLGEFLAEQADVPVIAYSDHGHRTFNRAFHVNSWLYTQGFLARKSRYEVATQRWREIRDGAQQISSRLDSPLARLLYGALFAGRTLVRSWPALHKLFIRLFPDANLPDKARPLAFGEQFAEGAQMRDIDPGAMLDFSRTQAYAYLNRGANIAGININTEEGHPEGAVAAADYQACRERIAAALRQAVDPLDGTPLVTDVWMREELFDGEHAADFPDLMFAVNLRYWTYISEDNVSARNIFLDMRDSQHDLEGMFGTAGAIFSRQVPATRPGLADIAPTILCALGAQIPDDLDGQPLLECFSEAFKLDQPPVYAGLATRAEEVPAGGYDAEEERVISQRLRDLGYIE